MPKFTLARGTGLGLGWALADLARIKHYIPGTYHYEFHAWFLDFLELVFQLGVLYLPYSWYPWNYSNPNENKLPGLAFPQ